jgi:hypothetical protein
VGQEEGDNDYACDNTSDKIFLLSAKEVTTSGCGFAAYDDSGAGNDSRIRKTTDYSKASGAVQRSSADSKGDWWLRSPSDQRGVVRLVGNDGNPDYTGNVNQACFGIVPALCID